MSDLPEGWEWVTADQVTAPERHALAIGPFGSNLKVSDYRTEGVPLVFVRNIRADAFELPDMRFVSPVKAEALRAHQVRHGDLLITKMGDPPGDATIYPLEEPGIITADCIKLTPHPSIDVRYLLYAIRSPQVQHQIGQITQGVAQSKISLDRFRKHVALPLAPPDERTQIVTTVEEQFSRLDAGVEALKKARNKLRKLRDLLPIMLLDRVGGSTATLSHPRMSLADISEKVVDCPHSTPKFLQDGMPCIDTTCISPGVIHRGRLRYVDPESHADRIRRLEPQEGDLIFAREGTVGTTVMVPSDLHPCLGQRVMLFRPNPAKARSDYLCLVMNSELVKRQYRSKLLGSTVPHLNVRDAKELEVPVPTLQVQAAIAMEADRIMSILNAAEKSIEANLQHSSSLRSSILASAFSGYLP